MKADLKVVIKSSFVKSLWSDYIDLQLFFYVLSSCNGLVWIDQNIIKAIYSKIKLMCLELGG